MMINLENEVQREAECRRAFEQEAEEAYSRHDTPSTAPVDKARNWWRSVQELLAAYARIVASGDICSPQPAEIATVLSRIAGYLAVGRIPSPVSDVQLPGATSPAPDELQDIGFAIAYRKTCQGDGIIHNDKKVRINDRTPVKTLMEWYGVGQRTVSQWVTKYEIAALGARCYRGGSR
jgi:hypothetical protein